MKTMRSCLSVLCIAVALGACTASGTIKANSFLASEDTAGATSDGFPAPSRDLVWQSAMNVIREAGYVPDPNLSQKESGHIETRWRLALQPFSGRGHRERVTVQVVKVPQKRGFYRLETNVMRQANDNISDPSNPLAADWTEGQRNAQVEHLLNQRVEMSFLKGDVSDEFRRKYGLPSEGSRRLTEPKKEPQDDGLIPGLPFP